MYIKIRAVPSAKKELFEQVSKDHFKITVREKPKNNQANQRIVALVASHFKIASGKVRIISGHHSPSKILSVDIETVG